MKKQDFISLTGDEQLNLNFVLLVIEKDLSHH